MESVHDILERYGGKIVEDLRRSMADKKLNASGDTSRSIEYKVTDGKIIMSLEILAHLALIVLERGRGPNRGGSGGGLRAGIEKWVDSKPIRPFDPKMTKDQLVFLIVRKIAREGIKVPNRYNPGNVISDVITDDLIRKINREVIQSNIDHMIQTVKQVI